MEGQIIIYMDTDYERLASRYSEYTGQEINESRNYWELRMASGSSANVPTLRDCELWVEQGPNPEIHQIGSCAYGSSYVTFELLTSRPEGTMLANYCSLADPNVLRLIIFQPSLLPPGIYNQLESRSGIRLEDIIQLYAHLRDLYCFP